MIITLRNRRAWVVEVYVFLFLACMATGALCLETEAVDVTVCAIVQDPTRYAGHFVSVFGDFESDGIEHVILSDRSCGKAIALLLVPTPKGYDALSDVLQGGMPGTLDKAVKARFTGIFRWRPDKTPKAVLSVDEVSEVSRDPRGRTPLKEFQEEEARADKQILTSCALIKDAMLYDGHMVLVEGIYRVDAKKAILRDAACPEIRLNLQEDLGHTTLRSARSQLESLAKKDKTPSIKVVFRGIFRLIPDPRCITPVCAQYEIETKELVSTHELTGESGGMAGMLEPSAVIHDAYCEAGDTSVSLGPSL